MLEVSADFKPVEVRPCDKVHDTGNRVRTIDRGRAILQHLDPADSGTRDHVGVDEQLRLLADRIGVIGLAAPIDQDQRPGRAKPAQVHIGRAFKSVRGELVGLSIHTRRHAKIADQFRNGGRSFKLQLTGCQHINRQRGIFWRTRDQRASNRNGRLAQFASVFLLRDGWHTDCQRNARRTYPHFHLVFHILPPVV